MLWSIWDVQLCNLRAVEGDVVVVVVVAVSVGMLGTTVTVLSMVARCWNCIRARGPQLFKKLLGEEELPDEAKHVFERSSGYLEVMILGDNALNLYTFGFYELHFGLEWLCEEFAVIGSRELRLLHSQNVHTKWPCLAGSLQLRGNLYKRADGFVETPPKTNMSTKKGLFQ